MSLCWVWGCVFEIILLLDGFEYVLQVLVFGVYLKFVICFIKNGWVLLLYYFGDLDEVLIFDEFCKVDIDYVVLFDYQLEVFVCDLYVGYWLFQYVESCVGDKLLILVQYYYVYLVVCMVDNGWLFNGGFVVGIILDGLGLGVDGIIWGGEFLLGDYSEFSCEYFLVFVLFVGGDVVQCQLWWNVVMWFDQVGFQIIVDWLFLDQFVVLIWQVVFFGINFFFFSLVGCLFDVVVVVLGLCLDEQSFEGEVVMWLEVFVVFVLEEFEYLYEFG